MKILLVMMVLVTQAWAANTVFDIKEKTIKGADFNFSDFKGKTLLLVNIASQCGYTKQLTGLESLYNKYKSKGLVLVGVPTNDFGGQTPESDKELVEFCSKTYQVTFPILTKKTILGKDQRPLYEFLTKGEAVKWNFEKFLVGKDGQVKNRFSSKVTPEDKDLIQAIEAQL